MRYRHIVLLVTVLLVALAAGCGGDDKPDVPRNAVAAVEDDAITRAEFDGLLLQARCRFEKQRRPFPKAGTPEYQSLRDSVVQFLVQRAQLARKAEELEVTPTDEQVRGRLGQIKKQYFGGNERRYRAGLAAQCLNETQALTTVKDGLTSEALTKKVTEDVKVTDADIKAYYEKNKQQYGAPASRDVRHILVKKKATADRLYAQLRRGASFAQLARRFSQDPGSKSTGGRLTVAKGQTVPPFDRVAFSLKRNELARPVKTQYGYHIIQALTPVRPAKTTPLSQVKENIRQQLLQTRRTDAMNKWVADVKKEFEKKTAYQTGFTPPAPRTTTAPTTG